MVVLFALLIPLLGVALLVTDACRQSALPFISRSSWRSIEQSLGGLSMCAGAILLAIATAAAIENPRQSLMSLPLLLLLSLVTLLAGYRAWTSPRSWPGVDEDWDDPQVIERCSPLSLLSDPPSARIRSYAWVMVLYPLLLLISVIAMGGLLGGQWGATGGFLGVIISIAAMFGFGLSVIVVTAVVHNRRGFQTQLLWLLTISIRNRIPLAEELKALGIRRGIRLKSRLQAAANNIERGDPLWLVLDREKLLPAATISSIRMAEGSDRLEETLRRLATQSTSRLRIFSLSNVADVLTQFMATILAVLTITSFLMYYIVPKLKEIFEGFDMELPEMTKVLVDGSDYYVHRGFTPMLFYVGIGLVVLIWKTLEHVIGWSSIPFPLWMQFQPGRDAPEILRSIAAVIQQQSSLSEKLGELCQRRGRPDLGARYQRLAHRLQAGETLSSALLQEQVLTGPQSETIAAAERAGHLEFVLYALADALEQREFRRSATWTELLKPASVVFCAVLVGFIAVAFFLPLVQLIGELS